MNLNTIVTDRLGHNVYAGGLVGWATSTLSPEQEESALQALAVSVTVYRIHGHSSYRGSVYDCLATALADLPSCRPCVDEWCGLAIVARGPAPQGEYLLAKSVQRDFR